MRYNYQVHGGGETFKLNISGGIPLLFSPLTLHIARESIIIHSNRGRTLDD